MGKKAFFVCLISAGALVACTKKQSAPRSEVPDCADGRPPRVLEGDRCPGNWAIEVSPTTGKKVCVFKYGPAISCPEGTKSTTYQAVCYGDVAQEGASVPESPASCEEEFGEVPNPAPYRLACCPN